MPTENHAFWTVTLGNVLSIVSGIIALGAFWWRSATQWQSVNDHIQSLTERQGRTEEALDEYAKNGILNAVNVHEQRITNCERALAVLPAMQQDISWIRRELDRSLKSR